MKVIAQMDDIFSIDINADSTFSLLLEAQNQGHQIYYYLPENLSFEGNEVKAYQIHDALIVDEKVQMFYVYERADSPQTE